MGNITLKNFCKMKDTIRIIMIDAFKPDYLKYAPYLSSLTKEYQWGTLEMPPGHNGGMEIFFRGKSNKLATFYKKDKSSLTWIKYFTWLETWGNFGRLIIDCVINFVRLIRRQELHRTGKIPLKKLHQFEISDNKSPHLGLPIEYTYFGSLDQIGHTYGTESKEISEEVKKIDKIVSRKKFDIILSDHGMIDVKKTIKVPLTKDCFIDSDMARYWGDKTELEKIKKDLPLQDGKILDWPNKSYGDLIFLVDPGILISPNYWYGKNLVRGMHGYDGKHEEMKGIYIIKKKGERKDICVEELHKKFKEMLNGK